MAEKTTIFKMYDDLKNAVKSVVELKYIFYGQRPDFKQADLDALDKFIVIELPVGIDDYAAGNNRFHLTTQGVFYLFSKSRENKTFKIESLSNYTEQIAELFPIKGEYIAATNPNIIIRGTDEYGFQIVTITFNVHTK